MSAVLDSLSYGFFRRALVEATIIGALSGLVGVHILLRRLPFYVVAISHSVFPGLVLASILGVSLVAGGVVTSVIVALVLVGLGGTDIAKGSAVFGLDRSTLIGIVLAGAFALGIVMVNLDPGAARGLSGLLVGSILTVGNVDVLITLAVGVAVTFVLLVTSKELVFTAFDARGAASVGYRPGHVEFAVLLLVGVVTVLAISAVGVLLAVALMTVPAMTARLWCDRMATLSACSAGLGATSGFVGLCFSAAFDVAAGGAIALTCGLLFCLAVGLRRAL